MSLPVDVFPKVMSVLTLLSQGRTLTSACDAENITISSFRKYVSSHEELEAAFVDAERRGYDTLAEVLLEIDRHDHYGSSDTKQQKVISDNIKWYLEKKSPEKYGNKVVVENRLTADRAIVDALSRARDRAIGVVANDVIEDAVFTTIERPRPDDEDLSQFM